MDRREGPLATVKEFERIYEVRVPTHKIVCPTCEGTGKHVNPAIDSHGISSDDECWQDEDFRDGYFGGRYDVTCHECGGNNVIDEIDTISCPSDILQEFVEYCNDIANDRRVMAQEMGMY